MRMPVGRAGGPIGGPSGQMGGMAAPQMTGAKWTTLASPDPESTDKVQGIVSDAEAARTLLEVSACLKPARAACASLARAAISWRSHSHPQLGSRRVLPTLPGGAFQWRLASAARWFRAARWFHMATATMWCEMRACLRQQSDSSMQLVQLMASRRTNGKAGRLGQVAHSTPTRTPFAAITSVYKYNYRASAATAMPRFRGCGGWSLLATAGHSVAPVATGCVCGVYASG